MTSNRLGAAFAMVALLLISMPWWMPPGPRNATAATAWASHEGEGERARAVLEALEFERDESLSATSWYNRGVALQERGDFGRAIAAYRAGGALSPRSGDIVHNIASARAKLDGGVPPPVGVSPAWSAIVTPGELGFFSLMLWWTALAALIRARKEHASPTLGAALGTIAALLTLVAVGGQQAILNQPIAVVLDEAVTREGATVDAPQRHILPPGTEVRVQRGSGAFSLVEDGKGRRGWVLREALEVARL